jgi:catechol 2,3-dioxygenase-like lactoylglutathione lyase family enzyme
METLGLRHAALYVRDPQASKKFYMDVLRMQLEWEPDADNVYLTSGGHDNLALHRQEGRPAGGLAGTSNAALDADSVQRLDHLGFALPTLESVDEWYAWIQQHGAKILREIKTHRDGARSFYLSDPDGVVIQMIYHPPIAQRAAQSSSS